MKPSITRWNVVLSKCPSFTYCRKFLLVSGAPTVSNSSAMTPWLVCNLTICPQVSESKDRLQLGLLAAFGRACGRLYDPSLFDDHWFHRHIAMRRWSRSRWNLDDAIDHVHAFHDLAEYTIAVPFLGWKAVVEHGVVDDIDEELRGCRMWIRRARHGQRSDRILQAVVRFITDWSLRRLLFELRGESSALDHEAGNYPMEDGAVIKAVLGIAQEILDRLRCLVGIELDDDGPCVCFQFDLRIRGESSRRDEYC